MRYMMLIFQDETQTAQMTPADGDKLRRAYGSFYAAMQKRGIRFSSEALLPTVQAKTLRTKGGRHIAIDGPFAETKEQVGGVFTVDCADWDEALEIAGMLPVVEGSVVEIRPILELGQAPKWETEA